MAAVTYAAPNAAVPANQAEEEVDPFYNDLLVHYSLYAGSTRRPAGHPRLRYR